MQSHRHSIQMVVALTIAVVLAAAQAQWKVDLDATSVEHSPTEAHYSAGLVLPVYVCDVPPPPALTEFFSPYTDPTGGEWDMAWVADAYCPGPFAGPVHIRARGQAVVLIKRGPSEIWIQHHAIGYTNWDGDPAYTYDIVGWTNIGDAGTPVPATISLIIPGDEGTPVTVFYSWTQSSAALANATPGDAAMAEGTLTVAGKPVFTKDDFHVGPPVYGILEGEGTDSFEALAGDAITVELTALTEAVMFTSPTGHEIASAGWHGALGLRVGGLPSDPPTHGFYKRGFEPDEVPPWFFGNPVGEQLTGPLPAGMPPSQDLFYVPVVGSSDYFCYTYLDNMLGVPPHPMAGGEQFVAGTAAGDPAYARAQRDIPWGTGLWMARYDVAVPEPLLVENNLGSFSVQPHASPPEPPASQSMIHLFSWVDTADPGLGWQAGYLHYDAADVETAQPGSIPTPSWMGLEFGTWYRFRTLLNFESKKIQAVAITNLETEASDFLYPTDWYLRGGAAGAPGPTGFRFFSGGASGGNAVAWDNLCIGQVGDLNCDGDLNVFDIDPFVLALTDPLDYEIAYPYCCIDLADVNGDGKIDAFDIDPFVGLLLGD